MTTGCNQVIRSSLHGASVDAAGIRRVLVLYTGGTIGMKDSARGYVCAPGYLPDLLTKLPMFHDPSVPISPAWVSTSARALKPLITPESEYGWRTLYAIKEFDPLLDSCNIQSEDWRRIAHEITVAYAEWDGFVVLHGTDTMAFTSSALSFMLENLDKTVVCTGSQIPLAKPRNDAIANFLGALTIAGHFDIPEVCLYFGSVLLRGNRATKCDAASLAAFESPNMEALAHVGIKTVVRWSLVSRPPTGNLVLRHGFSNDITILRIFPGPFHTLENTLRPPLRGLILQTFGAGNAPDGNAQFLAALRAASSRGVVIVNITQCQKGGVTAGYATGTALVEAGVILAHDMTCEAALVKLGWLLGDPSNSPDDVRRLMQRNMRGELTSPAQDIQFSLRESDGFLRSVYEAVVAQTRYDGSHREGHNVQNQIRSALMPTLVCAAAAQGNLESLQSMLQDDPAGLGASVVLSDYDLRTPLHLASSEGQLNVVKYLLSQQDARLNAVDRFGRTPLRNAVDGGHRDCVVLLVDAGGEIGLSDGDTAVMLATLAAKNDVQRLALYCLARVNVNAVNYDRRTALHVAYAEGNYASAQLLESYGADVRLKDRWGRTPLDERVKDVHQASPLPGRVRSQGPPPHFRQRAESFDSADKLSTFRLGHGGDATSLSAYVAWLEQRVVMLEKERVAPESGTAPAVRNSSNVKEP